MTFKVYNFIHSYSEEDIPDNPESTVIETIQIIKQLLRGHPLIIPRLKGEGVSEIVKICDKGGGGNNTCDIS